MAVGENFAGIEMSLWNSRGCVIVIHEPTRECAKVDDSFGRSVHKKKELAVKILRSRLWAEQNGYGRSIEEVSVCDVPDDKDWSYPNDFVDYREEMSK